MPDVVSEYHVLVFGTAASFAYIPILRPRDEIDCSSGCIYLSVLLKLSVFGER